MVEKAPSISVNKLAEFMTASPARQRQILKDRKYPTEYKGMYYKEAAESIAQVIASNLEDVAALGNQKLVLEQIVTDKIGTQRRIQSNIDALEGFETMLDKIELYGCAAELGAHAPQKLKFYGVEVSVRPEVILKRDGKSSQLIGAMKLHFPRQFPLNDVAAGFVSAVLQEWCRNCMADHGLPQGDFCAVVDVGSRSFFPGVKATAMRLKQVEAACQNIAALWPSITPEVR
jgi:hypothetical protein